MGVAAVCPGPFVSCKWRCKTAENFIGGSGFGGCRLFHWHTPAVLFGHAIVKEPFFHFPLHVCCSIFVRFDGKDVLFSLLVCKI